MTFLAWAPLVACCLRAACVLLCMLVACLPACALRCFARCSVRCGLPYCFACGRLAFRLLNTDVPLANRPLFRKRSANKNRSCTREYEPQPSR
ncbi:exported hypothetical protein [Paraburkholderia tropica]